MSGIEYKEPALLRDNVVIKYRDVAEYRGDVYMLNNGDMFVHFKESIEFPVECRYMLDKRKSRESSYYHILIEENGPVEYIKKDMT